MKHPTLSGYIGLALVGMVFVRLATAQMTLPSTTGVLPSAMPTTSLILGDDLSAFRSGWASPVNSDQQLWVNNIQSRANQSTSGAEPTTFGTASNDASIAQAAALRFAMTGSITDLNKAVGALRVAAVPEGTFITRPEVLIAYLGAYDFIRAASPTALPQATRDEIEGRLLSLTQSLDYGNLTYSNARAKIGATKAMAGVLLRDQTVLDQGLDDLQNHLAYNTTDDGWFTDSQGHYLNYTLRHVALFTRVYQQGSGVDLYANFKPYVDMVVGLRKPDGTVPNVSNGLNRPSSINLFLQNPDPAVAGQIRWYAESLSPSPFPWLGEVNTFNNDSSYAVTFALSDLSRPAIAPQQSPTFLASGQSKVSVFRNDWGSTSNYLLMSAGIDAPAFRYEPLNLTIPAFHTHNDTGEIQVCAKGHYILVSPGYERTDLPNSPANFTPKVANWHNVVLVDGDVGPDQQGRTIRPEDVVQTHRLDSKEFGQYKGVSDFSTLKMNYRQTEVTRSTAFPSEDYFVVADRMNSQTTHTYGFNLVGRGTRTVLTETPGLMEVKWEHGGVQAIEHLVGTQGMTLTTGTLWMHDDFNVFEQTQRITASMNATQGAFLSIIETGDAGDAARLHVTNLSTADVAGARVENAEAGTTDWILAQSSRILRTIDRLGSDALYAYIRDAGSGLDSAMLAEGTLLYDDGHLIFQADSPLTLSLLFGNDTILGTISADGLIAGTWLDLYTTGQILSATLNGVPIPFVNGSSHDAVQLTGAGDLVIEYSSVPDPASCLLLLVGGLALRRRR